MHIRYTFAERIDSFPDESAINIEISTSTLGYSESPVMGGMFYTSKTLLAEITQTDLHILLSYIPIFNSIGSTTDRTEKGLNITHGAVLSLHPL